MAASTVVPVAEGSVCVLLPCGSLGIVSYPWPISLFYVQFWSGFFLAIGPEANVYCTRAGLVFLPWQERPKYLFRVRRKDNSEVLNVPLPALKSAVAVPSLCL